jgi:hypothetical protein
MDPLRVWATEKIAILIIDTIRMKKHALSEAYRGHQQPAIRPPFGPATWQSSKYKSFLWKLTPVPCSIRPKQKGHPGYKHPTVTFFQTVTNREHVVRSLARVSMHSRAKSMWTTSRRQWSQIHHARAKSLGLTVTWETALSLLTQVAKKRAAMKHTSHPDSKEQYRV